MPNKMATMQGCGCCDLVASWTSYNSAGWLHEFTDTSSSSATLTDWEWDFDDGGTSTLQNPTHTYAAPGSYVVTLTVTDADGCIDTFQATIIVPNCTAASALDVANYLAAQGYSGRFVVGSGDYADLCPAGDCSALDGIWTIPYLVHGPAGGGGGAYVVVYSDDFTVTICGVSTLIRVELTIHITAGLSVSMTADISAPTLTTVHVSWFKTIGVITCNDLISLVNESLPELTVSATRCKTTTGNPGIVEASLIP